MPEDTGSKGNTEPFLRSPKAPPGYPDSGNWYGTLMPFPPLLWAVGHEKSSFHSEWQQRAPLRGLERVAVGLIPGTMFSHSATTSPTR